MTMSLVTGLSSPVVINDKNKQKTMRMGSIIPRVCYSIIFELMKDITLYWLPVPTKTDACANSVDPD